MVCLHEKTMSTHTRTHTHTHQQSLVSEGRRMIPRGGVHELLAPFDDAHAMQKLRLPS